MSFDAVYPQGYVPLHANPVDDVLAKTTIKVVIDGGTRRQKTYTFSPTDEDAFRTDVRIHDVNPAFPDIPSFFIIPRMAPLSPGHHTYEFIWVLSAPHCGQRVGAARRRQLPPRRRERSFGVRLRGRLDPRGCCR